jgi:hypothetical protein
MMSDPNSMADATDGRLKRWFEFVFHNPRSHRSTELVASCYD